jgi:hypothetical protein
MVINDARQNKPINHDEDHKTQHNWVITWKKDKLVWFFNKKIGVLPTNIYYLKKRLRLPKNPVIIRKKSLIMMP